jgi:hypothetical protein
LGTNNIMLCLQVPTSAEFLNMSSPDPNGTAKHGSYIARAVVVRQCVCVWCRRPCDECSCDEGCFPRARAPGARAHRRTRRARSPQAPFTSPPRLLRVYACVCLYMLERRNGVKHNMRLFFVQSPVVIWLLQPTLGDLHLIMKDPMWSTLP